MMSSKIDEVTGQAALQFMHDNVSLTVLMREDGARYRKLHEQALGYLNAQLMAGDKIELEPLWTAVYERLANFFVSRDTPALLRLTSDVESLPLQSSQSLCTRQFFLGIAYLRQAQYGAALETFTDLLKMPELDMALRARTLNARAVICRVTGRLEEAMAGYLASLELWEGLDDTHYQGIVNLNLGIISYHLRRYDQADSYLHRAEAFFRMAGSADWLLKTQSELGLVQRDLGHWDDALAYFDDYIARSKVQESWEDVGVGEINRGEVLLFKGEIEEAIKALQRSLQLTVARTYRVDPLLFLGLAYQAKGDLEQAEAYYEEAVILAQEINRREILPHVYFYQGDILRRQGDDEAALTYWQQASAVIQETHTPLRDESLKISLLGRWQQVYEALILQCAASGRVEEAFIWAERARARAFAEGLADDEAERPFATTIISLLELQAAIPEGTTLLCYFTTGVLEQDIPLLRAIPADNPLRPHILTPPKTLLFVITPTEIHFRNCPLDPNLFATSSPRGFDAKRFLKTAVLRRLQTDLLGTFPESSHLVIIPHGPLHRVPFTALLARTDDSPTLSFAPSGTIYVQQRERQKEAARQTAVSCLAVGYNGIGESRHLQFATIEAGAVAQTMAGQAWIDDTLEKTELRERAADCLYLHIACHGWFDDVDPLASYLELGIDERLTAYEVLETWTLQAELVTLSACETGISQILRGDEPMGLVRAFLYAGARTVLVSQWPVDDLATFLLMTRFYQEIQTAPEDLSLALATAQKWLRELTAVTVEQLVEKYQLSVHLNDWHWQSRPFANPEYWAGFVLVGG